MMHDHSSHCDVHSNASHSATNPDSVQERLTLAAQTCQKHGWRMTALRQQVFEIILRSPTPIGAYEILAALQTQARLKDKKIKPIAPPTVYRSLDFLIEHGFVHPLNSANTFIPCCHPREKHIVAFLICQNCQKVEEFSAKSIEHMLSSIVEQADFTVQRSVIEILGLCSLCQNNTVAYF